MTKKIFILLPDGVGLRNFAFTNFYAIGKELGYQVIFWNNTPFQLSELGFEEIKVPQAKLHFLTDIIKAALIEASLTVNKKNNKDTIYDTYRFHPNTQGLKNKLRYLIINVLVLFFSSQKGVNLLRNFMIWLETKTKYYSLCKEILKNEKPEFIFCTNQRPVVAIAPLQAAKDLDIPTSTFIFSWDNLPKATMVIQTDYYFVWSDYMKNELLHYYPHIHKNQIFTTGTPQFESHTNEKNYLDKDDFFQRYNLDSTKKYICYSGDDITTCPDDEQYLYDVAEAIEVLNNKGYNLGIIFRRSPADFTDRYEKALHQFKNIIVSIQPAWEKKGEGWNTVLPTMKDNELLINTIKHTEMVINLGSSMVFDYAYFNKPCLYINYDAKNKKQENWSVKKIYNFIHFRSMPTKEAVIWINSKETLSNTIELALVNNQPTIIEAKKWMKKIALPPYQYASKNIYQSITNILSNKK